MGSNQTTDAILPLFVMLAIGLMVRSTSTLMSMEKSVRSKVMMQLIVMVIIVRLHLDHKISIVSINI